MRITIDFHDNELKMSAFLTDKYAGILQQMGAKQVVKQPRKGPYDVTDYQTSHLCGGAIMGDNPGNSALNRYLQSWDVPNLFVQGRHRLSAKRRLQPDRHGRCARFLVGKGNPLPISQKPGAARPCVTSAQCAQHFAVWRWRCRSAAPLHGDIDKQDFKQIERGRYLTIVGDCAACHTLPGSGRNFAGGRPIETPFGNILAPNITPDRQTGIGAWTDDEFVNAMQKGTGRNGTHLYPAMPYTYYTKVTRDDALAIRAYLDTVPAMYNPVNPNQLPFPFNIRASMIFWDQLFFTPGDIPAGGGQERTNGIAAPIWPKVLGIVACATRRRIFWAGDKTSERCAAMLCKGGSPPISPAIHAEALAAGRSTRSQPISRPDTIAPAQRTARCPRRSTSRHRT